MHCKKCESTNCQEKSGLACLERLYVRGPTGRWTCRCGKPLVVEIHAVRDGLSRWRCTCQRLWRFFEPTDPAETLISGLFYMELIADLPTKQADETKFFEAELNGIAEGLLKHLGGRQAEKLVDSLLSIFSIPIVTTMVDGHRTALFLCPNCRREDDPIGEPGPLGPAGVPDTGPLGQTDPEPKQDKRPCICYVCGTSESTLTLVDGTWLCASCALTNVRLKTTPEQRTHAQKALKTRWHLLDWDVLEEVVKAMESGIKPGKYVEGDWMQLDNTNGQVEIKYRDAAMRHLTKSMKGQVLDPDDGVSHLAHCIASVMIARWHEKVKMDDMKGSLT